MTNFEIRQTLESKGNFDDRTLNCLTEYLIAVQNSFVDYISIEEAIRRFTEDDRLKNGIQIVDSSKIKTQYKCEASYSHGDNCIYLDKELIKNYNDSYIKFVIFHELTHVLSVQKRGKNEITGLQDDSKGATHNIGFNEAVTEFLAFKLMKENYNYITTSGYLVAVEQLINLMEIVPEKEIMDCYFNNGNNFENILQKNGIEDVDLLRSIFDILIQKEPTIVQIKRRVMPENENDSIMLVIKNYLYNLYTERFLPVDSMQKFEQKLKFVSQFINQHDSLNYVDEYGTYIDIMCDKGDLVDAGYEEEKIDALIEKYGLNKERLELLRKFNFLDETLNIADDAKRTEKAIELYELYEKIGRKKICDACDGFFIGLYMDFFLENPDNNKDLYNYMKLPFMGRFLKNHPQYDFDELSIKKVSYSKRSGSDWFYIVKTLDNKTHLIFEDFDDGTCFSSVETVKNNFIVSYMGNRARLEVKIDGDDVTIADLKNPDEEVFVKTEYSKRSNYEYLQEMSTRDGVIDLDSNKPYSQIFSECEKRIHERRIEQNKGHIDVT